METEDSSSPNVLYQEWQNEYRAALLEVDRGKLSERVAAATAIYERLQQSSQDPDRRAEHQAIEDALAGLRLLKRERLGFPDWEKK